MHILQPKHSKLKPEEAKKLLMDLNVSLSQIPLINSEDTCLKGLNVAVGDMIKVERKENEDLVVYYRVVV